MKKIERKIKEVIPDWDQPVKNETEAVGSLIKRAQILSDPEEKIKTLKLAGSLSPLEVPLQIKIGKAALDEGEVPSLIDFSIEKLEEAYALDSNNPEIPAMLITAYCHLANLDGSSKAIELAENYFNVLKELKESNKSLLCCQGKILAAKAFQSEEISDFKKAVEVFKKAEELSALTSSCYYDYAKTLFLAYQISPIRDYLVEGQILLQQGLRETKNQLPLQELALEFALEEFYLTYDSKGFEEIKRLYNTFHQELTRENLHFKIAEALFNQGALLKSEEILEQAAERLEILCSKYNKNPYGLYLHSLTLTELGKVKEELGQIRLGENKAKALIEIDEDVLGNEALGAAYLALGHYFNEPDEFIKAFDAFNCAIDISTPTERALSGLLTAQIFVGVYNRSTQLIAEAVDNMEKAQLASGMLAPFVCQTLGIAYFFLSEDGLSEEEDLGAAVDYFERALAFFDTYPVDDPDLLFHLGCSLDFLGDIALGENVDYYERSINYLQRSLEIRPDHYETRYHSALALSHLGEIGQEVEKMEEACTLFAELSEENPEDEAIFLEWGAALMVISQLKKDPNYVDATLPYLSSAEEKLKIAARLGAQQALYHLGCLYCLAGDNHGSLHFLEEAYKRECLPTFEEMLADEYLEGLRDSPEFKAWIQSKTV